MMRPDVPATVNPTTAMEFVEHGRDAGRGNLLGAQVFISAADYASAAAFEARVGGYLEAARGRGWLNARTLVVLPEHLGTWLAVADQGPGVWRARSLDGAMRALALRHPRQYWRARQKATERDPFSAGLFRMQAEQMAAMYQAVFARLAAEYGVTIVAGSIVLPGPHVQQGAVCVGQGPLENVSAVFAPDGRAHPALARKAFPTVAEQPFLNTTSLTALPVFDTPAGRLGVLVCADSWHPAAYAALKAQRVERVAVPSLLLDGSIWHRPWGGYNGASAPSDVDPADVGRLTEGQAWRKYALPGRLAEAGCQTGLNVFLRGQLWDQPTDGYSVAVDECQAVAEAHTDGSALINLWLN